MKNKNLDLTCKDIGALATNDGRYKKNYDPREWVDEYFGV